MRTAASVRLWSFPQCYLELIHFLNHWLFLNSDFQRAGSEMRFHRFPEEGNFSLLLNSWVQRRPVESRPSPNHSSDSQTVMCEEKSAAMSVHRAVRLKRQVEAVALPQVQDGRPFPGFAKKKNDAALNSWGRYSDMEAKT
ncbi:hypothetical protein E5288_WYG014892 [Bos mutus]|uniref:Uncharacterized protein n=1 Tax=Bos mutus TaxID=72004 RepID=A0A6B0S3L3_9CETA|nr:hypothetical protein [Bos mutus]